MLSVWVSHNYAVAEYNMESANLILILSLLEHMVIILDKWRQHLVYWLKHKEKTKCTVLKYPYTGQ